MSKQGFNSVSFVIDQEYVGFLDQLKLKIRNAQIKAAQSVNRELVQLPWFHAVLLMQRVKNMEQRNWYANQAIKNGCSRSVLELHIEQSLYKRQALTTEKVSKFVLEY